MRSYMVKTLNEAILNGEQPGRRMKTPLAAITAKDDKVKKSQIYPPAKNISEEVFQFLSINDDFVKTYGLDYFKILQLPWDQWQYITNLVIRKKTRDIELNKASQRKADASMKHMRQPQKG